MNHQTAKQIVDLMVEFGSRLNESVAIVETNCARDEFELYRLNIGKLMGGMLIDILNPILKEHPNLKPDRLR